jgi:hypothetical protein
VPEPHQIRLGGPWEVRLGNVGAMAGRMTIPGTLRGGGWPGYVGPVSFYRRFGRPTNLETGDRLRLAFAGVTGPAEVRLNGVPVGVVNGSGAVDVTHRLRERNELEVVMEARNDRCGITADVFLEIEAGGAPDSPSSLESRL